MASNIPAILKRHRAGNSATLRKALLTKYPFLEPFVERKPTYRIASSHVSACHGDRRAAALRASKEKACSSVQDNGLLMYVFEVDKEYNRRHSELRLFAHGIDVYGNVVRAEFANFFPYFFAQFPLAWGMAPENVNDAWCDRLRAAMESAIRDITHRDFTLKRECVQLAQKDMADATRLIRSLRLEWQIYAAGFNADKPMPVLRVECVHWKLVPVLRRICENPFGQEGIDASAMNDYVPSYKQCVLPNWVDKYCPDLFHPERFSGDQRSSMSMHTFEADVDYTMRFHADKRVSCGTWWRVWGASKEDYNSTSNFNVDAIYRFEHENVARMRKDHRLNGVIPDDVVFLFDGEMTNKDGAARFPRPHRGDPIIQMGIQIMKVSALAKGKTLREAYRDNELFAGVLSTKPISSFETQSKNGDNRYMVKGINCRTELDLIVAFEEIMLCVNPTYYVAYNGNCFDWPYIEMRARMLRSGMHAKEAVERTRHDSSINDYFCVGRDFRRNKGFYYRKAKVRGRSMAASAKQDTDKVFITGCQNWDLLVFVRTHKKFGLTSFRLDDVSEHFLGEKKMEIDHTRVHHMFNDPDDRQYVAKYCNRDVELMSRLMLQFDAVRFLRDVSDGTLVSSQKLIDRGAQYMITGLWYAQDTVFDIGLLYTNKNVWGVVYEELEAVMNGERCGNSTPQCSPPRMILPTGTFLVRSVEGPRSKGEKDSFDGAVMVEPVTGMVYYAATYDFASLYPSIIRTFNIGPTTIVAHASRDGTLNRVRDICARAHVPFAQAVWTRTENWYCTDEREDYMSSLEEAIEMYESEHPIYDEAVRASLKRDYEYVMDPANKEYVDKWSPLAFSKAPHVSGEEVSLLTDEDIQNVYMKVVEPVCRLTGRTKTRVHRDDMPQFVQRVFREGVYAYAERVLAEQRSAVKREMGAAYGKVEALKQEGKDDNCQEVVQLMMKARELNVKQLAIKLLMNSIYGVYAAKHKMKLMAESVTDMGRYLIEQSVCFVDTIVHPSLNFMSTMSSMYGDTDSVFGSWDHFEFHDEHKSLFKKIRNWPLTESRGSYAFLYAVRLQALNKQIQQAVQTRAQFDEKQLPKVKALIAWKRLLHDCLRDTDKPKSPFHISSSLQSEKYEPLRVSDRENRFFDRLMHMYDDVLRLCLGTADVVSRIPDTCALKKEAKQFNPPPLPKGSEVLTPTHIHDALQWILIQIFVQEGERIGSILNGVYARQYRGCIVQEFEKFYTILLMTRKKKYGGHKFEPGQSGPKCDVTGLSSVRGDSYQLKSFLCRLLLKIAVEEGDIDKLEYEAMRILKKVAQRRIPIYMLTQSKGVKCDLSEYGERQPEGLDYLVPTKFMPCQIQGAIIRNLVHDDPLPLVDSRYEFIIAECEDTSGAKINKHKKKTSVPTSHRCFPPIEALRRYGHVRYDKQYYLDNLSGLISKMLGVVFDPASMSERRRCAERFRRTRDKEERSEKVNKHFSEMHATTLKRIEKFNRLYVNQKVDLRRVLGILRDDDWTPSKRIRVPPSLCANDIIEYEDEVGERPMHVSDAQLSEIDNIAAVWNNGGRREPVISYVHFPDARGNTRKRTRANDGFAKKLEKQEKERVKRVDSGTALKGDKLVQKSILSMYASAASSSRRQQNTCTECGKRGSDFKIYCLSCTVKVSERRERANNDMLKKRYDQAIRKARSNVGVMHLAKITSYKCLACMNTFQEEPFCAQCIRSGLAQQTLYALSRHTSDDLLTQANVCSKTCVDGAAVQGDDEQREIADIEDAGPVVDQFYRKNPGPANCEQTHCPNRWDRAQTDGRRAVVHELCEKYLGGTSRACSSE